MPAPRSSRRRRRRRTSPSKAAAATACRTAPTSCKGAGGQVRVVGAFSKGRRTGSFLFWSTAGVRDRAAAVRRRRALRHARALVCAARPRRRAGAEARSRVCARAAGRAQAVVVSRRTPARGVPVRPGYARRARARSPNRASRCPTPMRARWPNATCGYDDAVLRVARRDDPRESAALRTGDGPAGEGLAQRRARAPRGCGRTADVRCFRCFDAVRQLG